MIDKGPACEGRRSHEEEGNQETPDAPIAVEEGVNGFELGVRQADLDQKRQIVFGMQEFFEIAERTRHDIGRRRNEGRLVQRATTGADPVLRAAQFARRELRTAHPGEKLFVDFADETHRDGQIGQPREPVIHGGNVVDDLVDVPGRFGRIEVSFGGQEVLKRTLRALNLARQYRFLTDIHENEKIGVRQGLDRAIEPSQGQVGLGQQALEFALEVRPAASAEAARGRRSDSQSRGADRFPRGFGVPAIGGPLCSL